MNGIGTVDGIATQSGLVLPNVLPHEEKIITFRAGVLVDATERTIVNDASATIQSAQVYTSRATIYIRNRGTVLGAATVVTGPEDFLPWLLGGTFLAAIGLYFGLFRYRYAGAASLSSAWSDMRLQWHAWRIRRRENF